ncbi:hypothetical protein KC343_g67 [Hortaea werneckii]|nr:hypothetical protein KC317_g66 [Hortaea werneckii]KAI7628710.1 hypothetical protein KC346_g70 [Hortaea werneckii]KAI7638471.1 hypothetical protein KC343_g67 [Hortaea werneckii]
MTNRHRMGKFTPLRHLHSSRCRGRRSPHSLHMSLTHLHPDLIPDTPHPPLPLPVSPKTHTLRISHDQLILWRRRSRASTCPVHDTVHRRIDDAQVPWQGLDQHGELRKRDGTLVEVLVQRIAQAVPAKVARDLEGVACGEGVDQVLEGRDAGVLQSHLGRRGEGVARDPGRDACGCRAFDGAAREDEGLFGGEPGEVQEFLFVELGFDDLGGAIVVDEEDGHVLSTRRKGMLTTFEVCRRSVS